MNPAVLERVRRNSLSAYGLALLLTFIAIALRVAVAPIVGAAVPFVMCSAAAIYLAWYRGFWPAAFSILLSASAGAHFVFRSEGAAVPRVPERASVAGFVLINLAVVWVIDFQRRTTARANAAEGAQRAVAAENARLLAQARATGNQLAASNHELQVANTDLEAFAWSVSHDLQEPLRTISIYAELLAQARTGAAGDGEEGKRSLDQIVKSARRMSVLIRDILAYTRSSQAEEDAPPLVDSKRILREVLDELKPSIDDAKATVQVGDLPEVAIHESRLAQIFQNLIGNALKYHGARDARIDVGAEIRDGQCVFAVRDNGIGIEAEFAEQIFALFKRLHPHDDYPGSGIGLAVCRRIIEHYGGRIWLEKSASGEGSVFCFSIPAKAHMTENQRAKTA